MTAACISSILLVSALVTPKGADVFPPKAIVVPPAPQGKVVMFEFPNGFVKTNYIIQLEETADLSSGHWWPGPTGQTTNDMDTNGILTIRATQPVRFYRLRCVPKSLLSK